MKTKRIAEFYQQSFAYLSDFEPRTDIPNDPRGVKDSGIYFYKETPSKNILINISHAESKGVSTFGISHSCYIQFKELEKFYLPVKSKLAEKGVSSFMGIINPSVTLSSTVNTTITNKPHAKDIDLLLSTPVFDAHLRELVDKQASLESIVDLYNKVEGSRTCQEVKKSISHHVGMKRMILKALLKAPDFHSFSDWWIRYFKMIVDAEGRDSSKHIYQAITELYATLKPVYNDQGRGVPPGVVYNEGPIYLEDEMKRLEEYQR